MSRGLIGTGICLTKEKNDISTSLVELKSLENVGISAIFAT